MSAGDPTRVGAHAESPPPETHGPPRSVSRTPRRITAAAMVLAIGAFAIVLAGLESELFDLERHSAPKELALHAVALVLLLLLVRDVERIELRVVDALLCAFLAWSAVSAALATHRWLALRALGVSFSALVVYLAARGIARSGLRGAAVGGLAAAAAVGGALGVAQAYGAVWPLLADSRPPGATFGNRNFLAHLMAIATPALLLGTVRARGRLQLLLWLTGLALVGMAIVLTRSRAAWLGLAAALGVMLAGAMIARRGSNALVPRGRRVLAAATLVFAAAAAVLVPNRLEWRTDSPYAATLTGLANYREGSGQGRLIQYRNSLLLVEEDPVFGVGPGNWPVHYPRVTTRGDPSFAAGSLIPTNPWPSSDWVALLTERGAVAVLLVLLAGGAAALTAARRLMGTGAETASSASHGGPGERDSAATAPVHALALLGTLAAATITGAFDAVLLLPAPAFFVAALTGLLLPETRPVLVRRPGRRALRAVRLGLPLVALVLVASSLGQVAAIRITAADPSRAAMQRAVRFDPGNHRLHLLLARRGPCRERIPHARAAAALLPFHSAPRRALEACGARIDPE